MYGELVDYKLIILIMKELSIIISVTPIANMKKSSYTFIADPFDFSYTIEKTNAGNCFNCDKDITIELPDSDIVHEFSTTRRVIVHLRDSSNRIINLGTTDIPALVTIVPYLNTATLNIVCKMLRSPFIP
jgi:hypothetical protein|nr:MAG TPA: hypothetical protein [Caudoviricetes sp.]